jgi:formate hydrogenlyase subunit 3/multisubunit Na+/H+ antiporter MnhD subunit
MTLLLAAFGILIAGAFVALASGSGRANRVGPISAASASAAGLAFALMHLRGTELEHTLARELLFGGRIMIGIDPLSSFFLVPVFGLGGLGAIYGAPYLSHYAERKRLGAPWFSYNLLIAAMALVLAARDTLSFLVGWEIMSLAAYSLVSFEHEIDASRRAGWIYLLASHVAMVLLAAMFLMLGKHAGSLELSAFAEACRRAAPPPVILALALAGFGIKAGIVPVHVWLPEAHAAAPSHVSALMSGVLIKMGVYGLLRTIAIVGPASAFAPSLLITLGLASSVVGIGLALYQRDMKKAMAYSSVENVGIIILGAGVGLHGLSSGRVEIAALGFVGSLLHVWSHAITKGLLFLAAGSVLHGTGTKDVERLGGVLKDMPRTGLLMVGGAVAISALPPLGGFAGEWLIYVGLMRNVRGSIGMSLAVGILGLVGCLTALCFVRIVGTVLLGSPRDGRRGHESPAAMIGPMAILLACSSAIALAPSVAAALLDGAVAQIAHQPLSLGTTPIREVGWVSAGLSLLIATLAVLSSSLVAKRGASPDNTWGCGYAAPTERMQYTGSGFAELAMVRLLPRALRSRIRRPDPLPLFAGKATFSSDASDPMTRGIYEPFFDRWASRLSRLRWMQQGALHLYLVYILVTLVVLLAWITVRTWRLG